MHRRLISIALSAVAAAAVAGVLIAGTGASARCARCRVFRAVDGDATGLRAALDNLLENAARHGASTVRVSLTATAWSSTTTGR